MKNDRRIRQVVRLPDVPCHLVEAPTQDDFVWMSAVSDPGDFDFTFGIADSTGEDDFIIVETEPGE